MHSNHSALWLAAVFGVLSMGQAFQAQASAVPTASATALSSSLAIGHTQEIKLDEAPLFKLKPGQDFVLNLGKAGTLAMTFEHATASVNQTRYWEARLRGDAQKRVSLKRDAHGLSGSVVLQAERYWISQFNGKTFITRMANATPPSPPDGAAPAPSMFSSFVNRGADGTAVTNPPERPEDLPAIGSWPVALATAQLRSAPLNSELNLNLPDGRAIVVVHDHKSLSESGNYTFVGYAKDHGTDYRVVLTTGIDGDTYGVLNLPEGELRVETRHGQQWVIDPQTAGIHHAPLAEPPLPEPAALAFQSIKAQVTAPQAQASVTTFNGVFSAAAPAAAPSATSTVDLMVLYTPGMVGKLGSDNAVRTRIDNLVAVTNQIMRDSGVNISMRLVRAMLVNRDDNISQKDQLNALISGQGAFSGVKAARDQAGADLVHFLHKPSVAVGSCGIAYITVGPGPTGNQGAGYGVTDENCPNMVMAHELGHNFGNNHDHAQGGSNPAFAYAWGYIVPGTNLGDVMSYAPQHYYKYSNPRVSGCANQSCGRADWADASRAMNATGPIVANYRGSKTSGGGTPTTGSAASLANGRYQIQAAHSGKCIEVAGASKNAGANVQQGSCVNSTAQYFEVTNTGNGWYKLVNTNSRQAVDVQNNWTTDGVNIQQWPELGNGAQRFALRTVALGEYEVINQTSGKCMDVAAQSPLAGANVLQWGCSGAPNQRFRFYKK